MAVAPRPTPCRYTLHGLTLVVDRPLSRLIPDDCAAAIDSESDVHVRFDRWPDADRVGQVTARTPVYESPFLDAAGQPRAVAWAVDGGAFSWVVRSDGLEVVVDRQGREVWIDVSHAGDPQTLGLPSIEDYLLGPVLALILRRRGVVCLHASAIELNGSAVVLAGREGSGKSSLAAAFVLRGHRLVTDDLAALADLGDCPAVQPGAPLVQVRFGAIDDLARSLGAQDRFRTASTGEGLELDCRASALSVASPQPLAAVYVLDSCAPVAIEPLTGAAAVMALVSDSWVRALLDPGERAHEVDVVARLAAHVPVKRVAPHRTSSLSALADLIETDVT